MAPQLCAPEACTIPVFRPTPDSELERRIRSDYREMPGLRLSAGQTRRLWSFDGETCDRVLRRLVAAGFLRLDRNGSYARAHGAH